MEERKCVPAPEQEEERNKAGARSRADSIAARQLLRFWELGLRAVWYCMIADNVVKALLFAVPALRFLFPGKPRSEKA